MLLLEAGGRDTNPWIHIPLGYGKLYANPKVNWCFSSEPETHLNKRRLFQPRGKVLGGTGSINGMIYMRGQPADFDGWAREGCVGWGWDDVLPYFKSCEDQERGSNSFHGVGGPVAVSDLPGPHLLGEAFHTASERLGIPRNDDFNAETQLGTGYVQTTTRNGRRWSTARGYLRGPAMKNITLALNAHCERIDLEDMKAVGVTWTDRSGSHSARAGREVILCCGTFGSPQILQVSGVGEPALLAAHGIEVQHALAGVGNNLQDHFGIGLEFESTSPTTVNDLYHNWFRGGWQFLRYLLTRTGPFADNGNYSNTFIRTSPDIQTPDMMITFMAWFTDEHLVPRKQSGFTILCEHMRPDSRGHVRITSSRSYDPPAIRFNFFASDADHLAALRGIRFARRISQTSPMREMVKREVSPGLDMESDDQLVAYCRQNGLSLLHPVGTCKMGTGPETVVDPRLRVHGLQGLRVADASIMPRIVTGNTNAATIMIGERAAAMILEDSMQ